MYFPERAVHMFPSELSTGLCSLNPHVDRLVQSCLMEVDRRGTVVRYELHDGVIHSDARMTYTDVNAILTDRDPEHDRSATATSCRMFEPMHELFEILNTRRHRRGSIDFDLKEAEIVLDDEGMVEAIIAAERNVAHRLIEEFMLLANETVAQHLDDARGARRCTASTRSRIRSRSRSSRSSSRRSGYSLARAADGVEAARISRSWSRRCAARPRRSRLRS